MTDKIQGHITPRMSWPRPATPTDLQPNWAGEFSSFDDWVNFARQRLTGTVDPLTGGEVSSICVDAHGRRCTIGAHFHRARDENAFPVRFFWDCGPPAEPPRNALDRGVKIGLIMAATTVMVGHSEDVIAETILIGAGITSRQAAIDAGVDGYDLEALAPVFAELERKDALAANAVRGGGR